MVSQADYNHHEAPLVPEALRVYRHFVLHEGLLYPVGMGGRYHPRFHPYAAECRRSPARNRQPHPAPDPGCKCGFYASYDPGTDFYPSKSWGGVGTGVIVRAVVEMSGRVVMGSRGVRAEKMKIVAFAIDWSKFHLVETVDEVPFADIWPDGSTPASYANNVFARRQRVRNIPTIDDRLRVEDETGVAAHAYGARFFYTTDEMHEAYPKPDIEHLKPPPGPPSFPEGIPLGDLVARMQAQMYAAGNAVSAAAESMRKALGALQDATVTFECCFSPDLWPLISGQPMTVKERALAMKKDPRRKGPTRGKGINYRA